MKNFCIISHETESILLKLGSDLGKLKVNIEGLCVVTDKEKSIIHFAVEDSEKTLKYLDATDIHLESVSDVYVFSKDEKNVTGKPGSFGEICQRLKENNVSIKFGYPAENNRFIFGVDDIEKTKGILE